MRAGENGCGRPWATHLYLWKSRSPSSGGLPGAILKYCRTGSNRAGGIVVRFATPNEALEKLVALAMAIGSNREAFDTLVSIT